ncbi:MAG TPA: SH3 domain-containing protein [Burkholderiales bacterium]|nr:SH3 domain-containing protein [Burkholderiales bacterium]
MTAMRRSILAAGVTALMAAPACALEFRSVSANAAVLYDAPSAKSRKIYIVNQGYPLEVVVVVEGWVKVRDANGELTWVERKALSDRRTVMVKVPVAPVRQAADETSPVVFQVQQDVILELEEVARGGWLRVKHRDGQTGFIKAADVWGV